MRAVRFIAGLLWISLALVLIALPGAGLALGMPWPEALPPGWHAPELRTMAGARSAGTGTRSEAGGLMHLHLAGSPIEIGAAQGILMGDRIAALEGDMVGTFIERVPTFPARHLLLGLVAFNNRNLADHFTGDERLEIRAATAAPDPSADPWRALGPPYQRAIHYHALHDASQYLIDNPLVRPIQVGCTAFAASGRSGMVVGRLFDFEGGTRFDTDKVVMTVAPGDGQRFVHIAWAGMSGAVTGINESGLWVSLNAAATADVAFTGRPIVMALREILQHARTIDEAVAILRRTPVFVSAGVLLATPREAVVVEIGPGGCALRQMTGGRLALTNHFQSPRWTGDPVNRHRQERGTTVARLARLDELLDQGPVDPARAAAVLRDRRGRGGRDLGFNHRATINSWIAAHLAVADLDRGILWVSEPPHGLGRLRAFTVDGPIPALDMPADDEADRCHRDLAPWLAARAGLLAGTDRPGEALATMWRLNPEHFETWWLAGLAAGDAQERRRLLTGALARQPAYAEDAESIQKALAGTGSGPGDHRAP